MNANKNINKNQDKNKDKNKKKDKKNNIQLDKIIYDSLLDNKILGLSIGSLFVGYWFQDIMFSRTFSKILANIPEFAKDVSFSKILGILFPYFIAYFLFYVDDMILANVFPKMETDIIHKLLDQIFESIKTTKQHVNINELMLNLKSVMDIKNIYNLTIVYLLPTLIIGCGLLYYFFKNDTKSGLIVVAMLALFIMLNIKLEKQCIQISQEHEQKIDKLYDDIQDIMINSDTIVTCNTKDKELNNIEKSEKECCNKHKKSEIINSEITLGLSALSMIFMFMIDGVAINLYHKEIISPDLLITMCMLSYTFIQYYNSSVFKFKSVMHYIGRYKELVEYFSKFEIEKDNKNTKANITDGGVVFKNVQPIHENTVLNKKININISGKTKVGIIGEIGTGKTSILKILAGLKKYKGEVYIDGRNLSEFSNEAITENIIYIPQHPKLFNRTILENLSYGTEYTKDEILSFINNLGLNKFFKKFENGIYSNVGKEGGKLSGGQKQIVALIRAIIHQKKIILLDEPTSSLDAETKQIFINLIETIKDKTIIVVTHDKTIHDLFDDMIEL
jgi:ABC-type bacteriocin/lantibiotic exporter with double-glycine peptidase domain